MKKILFILILFPFLVNGQDWRSVPSNTKQIYRVVTSVVDSMWNGYLRNIYIVDSNILGTETVYKFYPSTRQDHNNIVDTSNGPTWLGKIVSRKNNGDEYFLNKYLDTIKIITHAGLNQSWIMGYDTSGLKYFEATVQSIDTTTIDGVVDSIKRIGIQAFVGALPTNSIYNNYQIVLSKEHGFYKALDLYGFPNYEQVSLNPNPAPFLHDVYPVLPYVHHRLDSSITYTKYTGNDIQFQYQPGNNWILKFSGSSPYPGFTYDSIMTFNLFHPDSAIITYKRESIHWTFVLPNWVSVYSNNILTDTVFNSTGSRTIEGSYNVGEYKFYGSFYNKSRWTFLDSFCNNRFTFISGIEYWVPAGGYFKQRYWDYADLDFILQDYANNPFHAGGVSFKHELVYYQFNGCNYGTYFSFKPDAVSNYGTKDFKVYPNPTLDRFFLETDIVWKQLEIINLQGQVLLSYDHSNGNPFSLATLSPGLYIVKVKTDDANFLYKILKQ